MTNKNPYQLQEQEIKQLRRQANRAAGIARNLRQMAEEQAKELRMMKRADEAHANFYSKKSEVDPTLILTPDLESK